MSSTTRTGSFGIGFRIGWSAWQKDAKQLIAFAKQEKFSALDAGPNLEQVKALTDAGIAIGTVDLPGVGGKLITEVEDDRKKATDEAISVLDACAKLGVSRFFACMLPRQPQLERKKNQELMAVGFEPVIRHMEKLKVRLAVEGYPGAGAVCCTPESYRMAIEHFKSPSFGINYDPSHLIRMGIDPLRFVREFAEHVVHVHGKDCEIDNELLYQFGYEQKPIVPAPGSFRGGAWRYTLPGHGVFSWTTGLGVLKDAGYKGLVCIELEDQHFNGSEEGEKRGLVLSRHFLEGA